MYLAFTLFVVFMLSALSFILGFEVGNRMKIGSITPLNIIKPKFRLIYRNPQHKENDYEYHSRQ